MSPCSNPRGILLSITILLVAAISPTTAEPIKIYLLGGQSNAVGDEPNMFVPPEMLEPRADVQIYAGGEGDANRHGRWMDLGPGFGALSSYHGPELSFGHTMADNLPGETVAIIKYAWGATDLAEMWRPPDANGQGAGVHWIGFTTTAHSALAVLDANGQDYELAGMLWMQGENDALDINFSDHYEENLTNFIKCIRTEFSEPNLPFIIGQIFPCVWTYQYIVRQAQFDVADSLYNVEMTVTRDINCCSHYCDDGYIRIGRRFADQALWLHDPVQLVGPDSGASVGSGGALLTCLPRTGAARYQLLFGPDVNHINYLVRETPFPPDKTITEFPFPTTWWTVRVFEDSQPENLSCDGQPRYVVPQNPVPPITNLASQTTYNYLQDAIDSAGTGDVIAARPWVYPGSIDFKGKNITLRSLDPRDPEIVASTVITDRGLKPAVTYAGNPRKGSTVNFTKNEDSNCVLAGFTIITENEIYSTSNIRCCNDAGPFVANCVLIQNKAPDIYKVPTCPWGQCTCYPVQKTEAVFIVQNNGLPAFTNCLFTQGDGGGLSAKTSFGMVIDNCTIVGNRVHGVYSFSTPATIANTIIRDNLGPALDGNSLQPPVATVNYNNIQGGFPAGSGNIDVDPCFAVPGWWDNRGTPADFNDDVWHEGDYRLLAASVCIDAGNNGAVPPDNADLDGDANTAEPTPVDLDGHNRFADGDCNGSATVDMGAYEFAWAYAGDFDGQCDVDFADYAVLAAAWLTEQGDPGWNAVCDIAEPANGSIDYLDIDVLARNWLAGPD